MTALPVDVQLRLASGVGRMVRDARLTAGHLTPAALAKLAGLSQSTVAGIEAGRARPHPDALDRIAAAVHPDDPGAAGQFAAALLAAAGEDLAGREHRLLVREVLALKGLRVDDAEAGSLVAAVLAAHGVDSVWDLGRDAHSAAPVGHQRHPDAPGNHPAGWSR